MKLLFISFCSLIILCNSALAIRPIDISWEKVRFECNDIHSHSPGPTLEILRYGFNVGKSVQFADIVFTPTTQSCEDTLEESSSIVYTTKDRTLTLEIEKRLYNDYGGKLIFKGDSWHAQYYCRQL